jgi:hypothetical protein
MLFCALITYVSFLKLLTFPDMLFTFALYCLFLFFTRVYAKVRERVHYRTPWISTSILGSTDTDTKCCTCFVEYKTVDCLVSASEPLKQMAWHSPGGS